MLTWLYTLASVFLVSVVSLIGIFFLSLKGPKLQKILLFLVSFAVGALFGDAFIHLLPESFEGLGLRLATSLYVLLGILIFFSLEKFVRWRHCHILTSTEHPHPVATMNFIGDGIHNLIDGMIIGASYCVSIPIGIATTVAVVLHEIPQEIGDFGIFVHAGLSVKKALLLNLLSALSAILGAVTSLVLGPHIKDYSLILLPITAGGFIYIAGSDLIPELQVPKTMSGSLLQLFLILLGMAVMALLTLLE